MTRFLWVLACALAVAVCAPSVSAESLDLVGAYDPGTPGLNASAVGLDGFAYLGSWGSVAQCPGLGVRVFDVRDPTVPTLLGRAAAYTGTTAESAIPYPTRDRSRRRKWREHRTEARR